MLSFCLGNHPFYKFKPNANVVDLLFHGIFGEIVDDVPIVEVELKKASAREKAQKVIQGYS